MREATLSVAVSGERVAGDCTGLAGVGDWAKAGARVMKRVNVMTVMRRAMVMSIWT